MTRHLGVVRCITSRVKRKAKSIVSKSQVGGGLLYPLAFFIIPFSIMEYAISIIVVFGSLGWIPNTLVIRRVSKCMTCENTRTTFVIRKNAVLKQRY